jgi:hypothetical protein
MAVGNVCTAVSPVWLAFRQAMVAATDGTIEVRGMGREGDEGCALGHKRHDEVNSRVVVVGRQMP